MSQNDPAGLAHAKKLIKENLETKATFLDLGNCGLYDLSELPELWECQHLQGLYLGSWYWKDGKELKSKSSFKINEIGAEGARHIAENLKQLTSLNLAENVIEDEGARHIGENLKQLTSLSLWSNKIGDAGARHIAKNLKQLTSLHLGWNEIGAVGARHIAENLKQLRSLNLGSNEIGDEGGRHIAENLQQLTSLDLGYNEIGAEGARHIAENLKQLTSLHLGWNKIGAEGVRHIAENLKRLSSLDLRWNKIGAEGARHITEKLQHLFSLNLSGNNITTFWPFLQILNKKPDIRLILDFDFINEGLNLSDNEFTEPPMEVVEQGKEAILRYFDNLEKEKKIKLEPYINKEVKLILVGNSSAGKSTLAKYLVTNEVDRDLPSTHWMDTMEWQKPFGADNPIENIRIFDFGGQEYYHDTHHIFFSSNTAYLLMWDEEGNGLKDIRSKQKSPIYGHERDVTLQCYPLEYWLDAISCFSKNVYNGDDSSIKLREEEKIKPENLFESDLKHLQKLKKIKAGKSISDILLPLVLIVQNKLDYNAPFKLPLDQLNTYFREILIYDGISISLYNNRFLQNLRTYISEMLGSMNIVGKQFEGVYGIVRDGLLSTKNNMSMTVEDFRQQVNTWIVANGKSASRDYTSLQMDFQAVKYCAQVFSWLGYILYFPDSEKLNDRVFLNQNMITDSIYRILFDAEASIGEITKDNAKQKVELKEIELNNIFDLMQEFKIIFKHPDPNKEDTYIAPLYLSATPTKGISFFLSSLQKPEYRIQYDGFIHKSIILEFFQEYGQFVLKESNVSHEDVFYYWRNGIVVKKDVGSGKEGLVLVQFFNGEDKSDKDGKTGRIPAHIDIFSLKAGSDHLIKEILGKLTEINKGWKVTEMVTVDGHQFVPLTEIHKHEANKQYVFQYADQQFQLIHFKQYLKNEYPMKKVFISYSKSDEHYRDELEKHLSVLKRNGHIATWHDRKLLPGEKWDGKIRKELEEADIILFLVSSDFLATDYIWDVEIAKAIERDKNNESVYVVPIIVRPCDWHESPLGVYNSGTAKGRSISLADNTDKAFLEVVEKLKEIIIKKS